MNKILNFFAVALCAVAAGIMFSACGEPPANNDPTNNTDNNPVVTTGLTDADFVGEWYVETYVDNYYANDVEQTDTATYARFMELHNKANRTDDEESEYVDLETYIYKFKVTAEHTLLWKAYFADDTEYSPAGTGTWSIENNALNADITGFLAGTVTVAYQNGKIVVTATREWQGHPQVQTITLAKIVA